MPKKNVDRCPASTAGRALAKEMRLVFVILMKYIRRDLEKKMAAANTALSPLSFGVLHLLNDSTHTIKDLSDKLMLRPATLVPVVDSLEKRRLIKRGADRSDRRCHLLTLTPAGQKISRLLSEVDINNLLALQLKKIGTVHSRQLSARLKELAAAMIGPAELKKLLKQSL